MKSITVFCQSISRNIFHANESEILLYPYLDPVLLVSRKNLRIIFFVKSFYGFVEMVDFTEKLLKMLDLMNDSGVF